MELLQLDINNLKLMVNKSELLTINCFSTLIEAHKKKIYGDINIVQHLAYIYWCSSIYSPGLLNGYTGTTLDENAKTMLGIVSDLIPDDLTKECIDVYKTIHKTASIGLCEELLKGIRNITELAKKVNGMLANKLELAVDADIPVILNYQERLNDIVHKAPTQIEKLELLLKSVISENSESNLTRRGGGSITSSMIPESKKDALSKSTNKDIEEGI